MCFGEGASWESAVRPGKRRARQPLASATLTSDPSLPQMYHKHSPHFTVETNDAQQLVAAAAGNIEKLLAKRSEALKVSISSRGGDDDIFFFIFVRV